MKIGFDAKRLFHNHTGLGNYSRTLVDNLATHYPTRDYLLFTQKVSNRAEYKDFLSKKYQIVKPKRNSRAWRAKGMVKDIKAQGVNLFHGLSHDLPIGIHNSGAKSVVTIHDVCYKTFPKMFPLVERMIYARKYKYSCKVADKIIAISQSTKQDIIKYFDVEPSRIEVIYQSINEQFYEKMSLDDAKVIVSRYRVNSEFMLYVGSINSRKNLLGVIKAFAMIDPSKRMPLVVIGSGRGKYYNECVKEAKKLDVLDEIEFLNTIHSMQSLQAFYTAAECLVYPSFYEGFGLPVTEAILSCCPVVTSDVSSLPEAGGDVAYYVDPNSPAQIAGAINQILLLTDAERAELTQRGREEALEKFDPKKLTGKVSKLYKRLLR